MSERDGGKKVSMWVSMKKERKGGGGGGEEEEEEEERDVEMYTLLEEVTSFTTTLYHLLSSENIAQHSIPTSTLLMKSAARDCFF